MLFQCNNLNVRETRQYIILKTGQDNYLYENGIQRRAKKILLYVYYSTKHPRKLKCLIFCLTLFLILIHNFLEPSASYFVLDQNHASLVREIPPWTK